MPSESTFSRAFAESDMPARLHAELIKEGCSEQLVVHISRESTAMVVRENPARVEKLAEPPAKRKRGHPRKGEERPKEPTRVERQRMMDLEDMVDELPKECTTGVKHNAKGFKRSWNGYKLHTDVADCGIIAGPPGFPGAPHRSRRAR